MEHDRRNDANRLRSLSVWMMLWIVLCGGIELLAQTQTDTSASAPTTTISGDSARTLRVGGFVGGVLNQHVANFPELPGIAAGRMGDGIAFGNATSFGLTFGGLLEYPLSDAVSLGLRLGYAPHSAILQAQEQSRIGVLNTDGTQVVFYDATFGRELSANLASIGVEPLAVIHPFAQDGLRGLRFYAGLRLGIMIQRTFTQRESILRLSPNDASAQTVVFNPPSSSIVRNPIDLREIPQSQLLHAAVTAGIGYDFMLGSSLALSPEVFYAIGITPLVNTIAWSLNQVRGAVSLRYTLPPLPPAPPPPPPPPPKEVLSVEATIAAFTSDTLGTEVPLVQIKVEEFISRQMYPLLPYVFFDYTSSVIPARYHRLTTEEVSSFNENKFFNADALRVYYDVLNVVGKRLQQYPSAKITLTGCNDNTSSGEAENLTLSRSRAEEVRQYLHRTWNVDTARMQLRSRNLPEKPTVSKDSIGIEENRRVEISSASWEIMQPSLVYDTLLVPSAPVIRFRTTVKAEAGVAKSTVRAFQGERTLKQFTTLGVLEPTIEWNTAREQSTIPRSEESMKFSYEVIDTEGRSATPVDSIPVEQITIRKKRSLRIKDKEIDTYRLILFDFDSPEVGSDNARIIKKIVLPNVKPQSTVQVTGFTDKLGNAEVNQKLSEGRARNVSNLVASVQTSSKGFGAKMTIYPNEIPEGRFLSRTVEVRVETPIDE
jgi:outer membrane protein OmpA-like peptidoglycan-associated protein